MEYSGAGGKLIHEKNQKQRISWHCPFKSWLLLKVHKHEINFNFFWPKSKHCMAFVNFWKKVWFFSFDFARILMFEHFRDDWAYAELNYFGELSKIFFLQNVHFGPIRWVPWWFLKFWLITVPICILIGYFWVTFDNYSMRMLSIRGNDFIAHWAYEERISSHTESTPKEFSRMLNQWQNINSFYSYVYIHAEHARKRFHQVEYLGRIEYDLHKTRVTGPWDHKVSVSAKKVKKNPWLCTFKGNWLWSGFSEVFALIGSS